MHFPCFAAVVGAVPVGISVQPVCRATCLSNLSSYCHAAGSTEQPSDEDAVISSGGSGSPGPGSLRLHDLPLWRVQWAALPGTQEVLHVHVPHYTSMFERCACWITAVLADYRNMLHANSCGQLLPGHCYRLRRACVAIRGPTLDKQRLNFNRDSCLQAVPHASALALRQPVPA